MGCIRFQINGNILRCRDGQVAFKGFSLFQLQGLFLNVIAEDAVSKDVFIVLSGNRLIIDCDFEILYNFVNLIAVLPDVIKSPALTAEWESMLKQVERGEMTADAFMEGIAGLIRDLIRQNTAPDPAYSSLFGSKNAANREAVGTCPRCGGAVYEGKKGFFCENESCAFVLWKENRFFSSKKKTITKTVAAALLKEGRVSMSGLFSEKTGKTYDAVVVLDDTGEKYVNFKLEFPQQRGRKK